MRTSRLVPRLAAVSLTVAIIALAAITLRAQFVVYDPTNYFEAVAEYEQLLRQYEMLIQQAARLPFTLGPRYRIPVLPWSAHALGGDLFYAGALLSALNHGDAAGGAYRTTVGPLGTPTDVIARMPATMRQRLATAYATVEVADSANRLAIDQTGSARANGPATLGALSTLEADMGNSESDFQSQTALLQKITVALALNLRLGEQTNQFQLSALEQAVIDATRKRDTEAALVNATLHQWRYGQAYGEDLFSHTAARIDTWRPY